MILLKEVRVATREKHYIGWIITAKRPETRAKRLAESLALLGRGE